VSRLTCVLVATLAVSTLISVAPAIGVAPGVTTKTVVVSIAGRSFPARLSYPTRGGPYPALAFAHGFMARSAWYAGTLDGIARAGTVVIAPDSERGPLPSHSRFADDLNRSLAWLAAGHGTPRGKVDASRTAVAGHSMGGGVALLAAARSRTVDTVATLAAAETTPSAARATGTLRVPSLFVVGSLDRIVPAEGTAAMFDRATPPSLLAVIDGGSHCGFMEIVPSACDAGRISYERQLTLTRDQLRRWLDRYLGGKRAVRVTGVPGILYERR
jgi:dienelactone hydrolase